MNYKNGKYKEGIGVFQDDVLVAFVTNDKSEVTFIEGLNRVAAVSPQLVEHVYHHLKGSTKE